MMIGELEKYLTTVWLMIHRRPGKELLDENNQNIVHHKCVEHEPRSESENYPKV